MKERFPSPALLGVLMEMEEEAGPGGESSYLPSMVASELSI